MRIHSAWAILVVVAAILAAGCRPQAAAPVQQTVPKPAVSAPAPTPAPASNLPLLTSESDVWNKVVAMAREEGRVTAYSFNLTGDVTKAATEAFQNRYGIKLEIVGGVGAVLAERIKTESNAKKYVADTFDTGVTAILPLKELGLLANMNDLPVLKEKDAWILPPVLDQADGAMLRTRLEYQTAVINTNLVRPGDEPKSFLDFLGPKWKGKKLATAPPRVSWPLVYLHVMLPEVFGDSYLRSLGKQEMLIVSTMRDESAAVAKGDAHAAVSTSIPTMVPLVKAGAPLKAVAMKEGTISSTPVVTVLKNSPHPNAARVFVNWWLSPEGQAVINKAQGAPNIRKDVADTSYDVTRFAPTKLLPLDEAALRTVARYVAEGKVDKLLDMDVK
ncbi:MAG: extracellular solute-binding protein [Chloroflexi bacterium]|nr:extracellular solute-binding protein [Chloroflexota bacterium]